MRWTDDDRMLLMLYGEANRAETIAALQKMRHCLLADEAELEAMTSSLIAKLEKITDMEYQKIHDE